MSPSFAFKPVYVYLPFMLRPLVLYPNFAVRFISLTRNIISHVIGTNPFELSSFWRRFMRPCCLHRIEFYLILFKQTFSDTELPGALFNQAEIISDNALVSAFFANRFSFLRIKVTKTRDWKYSDPFSRVKYAAKENGGVTREITGEKFCQTTKM